MGAVIISAGALVSMYWPLRHLVTAHANLGNDDDDDGVADDDDSTMWDDDRIRGGTGDYAIVEGKRPGLAVEAKQCKE